MSLPVTQIFSQLESELLNNNRVILQAPPGAGKSTLLPLLLLKSGQYSSERQIIILEPRRVAARQIAQFLAKQLNEKVGQTIGVKMRGENKSGSDTVITIVTDGVMVRLLQSDPELEGVALVIFDEFHERALQTDLALALSLDAQELNEDIRLLIMSATLNLDSLSEALNAPVVKSDGRQFPVEVKYVKADVFPTIEQILTAIKLALNEQSSSILVFLSGVGEIRQIQTRLEPILNEDILCLPLHGGLTLDQQSLAIKPVEQDKRKIVLATNLAQTSLTIEGVDVVVDSGIEKVVQYQIKSANEELLSQPVSVASAIQRMGRAGRLVPGVCYRLGAAEQFERRRAHDVAEIERVDLSQLLLEISLWGAEFEQLFWLSEPGKPQLQAAKEKLVALDYWQERDGKIIKTELAANYQAAATNLRTGKMLLAAQQLEQKQQLVGLLATACLLAVYLENVRGTQQCDLGLIFNNFSQSLFKPLLPQAQGLFNKLSDDKWDVNKLSGEHLSLLLLFGYPDRIGKKQGKRWKLSNGSAVDFHASQISPNSELIVVVDYHSGKYGQHVQLFAPATIEELEAYCPSLIEEQKQVTWSKVKQQPQKVAQQVIGKLVLSEVTLPLNLTEHDWQQLWRQYVIDNGLGCLGWNDPECFTLRQRLSLARQHASQHDWPDWSADYLLQTLDDWFLPYVAEVRSVQQLKKLRLAELMSNSMDWSLKQEFASLCPISFTSPAGNKCKIDYQSTGPKISVKLQEMFGQPTSPSICNGQQPLLIELLSPAKRPLQVTQDLANFWQNAYVEVKKEMKGRYPKHPWPDDPVSFEATSKTKSQLNRMK